jgi:hypothetical protein
MTSPPDRMPVTGREHRALKKTPHYKALCKMYEKRGMSQDEARKEARGVVIGDPVTRPLLPSWMQYPSELTGIADPAYLAKLTNEFVEKYRDAPNDERSSGVIRQDIVARMERDGVEFGHDAATTALDSMVGHVIARKKLP